MLAFPDEFIETFIYKSFSMFHAEAANGNKPIPGHHAGKALTASALQVRRRHQTGTACRCFTGTLAANGNNPIPGHHGGPDRGQRPYSYRPGTEMPPVCRRREAAANMCWPVPGRQSVAHWI